MPCSMNSSSSVTTGGLSDKKYLGHAVGTVPLGSINLSNLGALSISSNSTSNMHSGQPVSMYYDQLKYAM